MTFSLTKHKQLAMSGDAPDGSVSPFSLLSTEIKQHILSFLAMEDLFTMFTVAKEWRLIGQDNAIWTPLTGELPQAGHADDKQSVYRAYTGRHRIEKNLTAQPKRYFVTDHISHQADISMLLRVSPTVFCSADSSGKVLLWELDNANYRWTISNTFPLSSTGIPHMAALSENKVLVIDREYNWFVLQKPPGNPWHLSGIKGKLTLQVISSVIPVNERICALAFMSAGVLLLDVTAGNTTLIRTNWSISHLRSNGPNNSNNMVGFGKQGAVWIKNGPDDWSCTNALEFFPVTTVHDLLPLGESNIVMLSDTAAFETYTWENGQWLQTQKLTLPTACTAFIPLSPEKVAVKSSDRKTLLILEKDNINHWRIAYHGHFKAPDYSDPPLHIVPADSGTLLLGFPNHRLAVLVNVRSQWKLVFTKPERFGRITGLLPLNWENTVTSGQDNILHIWDFDRPGATQHTKKKRKINKED